MSIINLIDIIFLLSILLTLNYVLGIKNFLVDTPEFSKHKIENKSKIILSGGFYTFFGALYFYYLNDLNLKILFFIFPFLVLGFLSDKNILKSPLKRIIFQLILIFIVILEFEIQILNTRIVILDYFLDNNYINILFTISCLLVLINGSNFIDGLNGLSCGYYVLICLSLITLINQNALNMQFENIFYYFFLILLIFIVFNFLNKNFMGDNGIYFLSTIIGIELIKFSNLNFLSVSPFYIVSMLWYPAFENLFSILRRIYLKSKISNPDKYHLHTLIYYKINNRLKKSSANNISSIIILLYCLPGFIFSNIYHNESLILSFIILINVSVYLINYFFLKNEK